MPSTQGIKLGSVLFDRDSKGGGTTGMGPGVSAKYLKSNLVLVHEFRLFVANLRRPLGAKTEGWGQKYRYYIENIKCIVIVNYIDFYPCIC